MSIPRLREDAGRRLARRAEGRGRRAMLIGVVVLVLALASASGTPAANRGSVASAGLASATRSLVTSESALCASINTNGSLNGTYSGIYEGLPGLLRNWTNGPNQSTPKGQGAYPTLAVGERQLDDAWISICDGSAYSTLYARWGPQSIFSGSELESTGYYVANYGFVYGASCKDSTDNSSTACEWFSTWYVNLSSGQIAGPVTSSGGMPLGTPPFGNGTSSPNAPALSPLEEVAVGALGVAAVLGVLAAVRVRRRGRSPPPVGSSPPSNPNSTPPHTTAPAKGGEPARTDVTEPTKDSDPLSDVY